MIWSLAQVLASPAEQHRATLIPGRTWMQHALPMTLGVKIAGWLDALLRHRERLNQIRERCLVLQFGGAVGTLAALGHRGPEVATLLAAELKLGLPRVPWHSHRDRIAEIGTTLGVLAGHMLIIRILALGPSAASGDAITRPAWRRPQQTVAPLTLPSG